MITQKLTGTVICLLTTIFLWGQTHVYNGKTDRFTTRNGLPHNTITALFQDKTGFLWVGTANGLCRYDGIQFKEVRIPVKEENHWEQVVETLYQDSLGRLWYASRSGGIGFRNTQDKWQRMNRIPKQGDFVSSFYMDDLKNLWVGSNNGYIGVNTVNSDSIQWLRQLEPEIKFLFKDKKEGLWVVSSEVEVMDTKNLTVKRSLRHQKLKEKGFWIASMDGTGTVLMTKRDSALQLSQYNENPKTKEFVWVSENMVHVWNSNTKKTQVYNIQVERKDFIANELIKDKSGLIWVATNDGLIKLDRNRHRFKSYATNEADFELKHNYVRALETTKDGVWIGFKQASISKLNYSGKEDSSFSYSVQGYNGEVLPKPTINTFLENQKGELWCAGLEGLFKFNAKTKQFNSIKLTTDAGKSAIPLESWALCEDSIGRLWVGTKKLGLWMIDKNEKAIFVDHGNNKNTPIWSMYCQPNGTMWVGTNIGLYQIKETYSSTPKAIFIKALEGSSVWDIKASSSGQLCLATTNKGFYIYDPFNEKIRRFTKDEGLPSNSVCSVQEDIRGRFWLSTVNGLCCLDYTSNKLTNYYEQDGLVSNDFNFGVSDVSTSGEIFYGSKNGMISFDPEIDDRIPNPDLRLTVSSFSVNGEETKNTQNKTTPQTFAHHKNNVSFSFSLLEFRHPKKHEYQYKLQPFDKEWRNIEGAPTVNYTSLPPLSYNFMVRASLNGDHWYHSKPIGFSIQAAIWQRKWFYPTISVFGLILLVIVLFSWLRLKIAKERRKNELEKKIARLELKALQAQMNPHFIFNVINSVQHFMLKDNLLAANDYLTRFARLMRFSLEASVRRYLPLNEELEMLELYIQLQALRFEFDYTFKVPTLSEMKNLEIPALLIQPFVENAIDHGLATKRENAHLTVEVVHKKAELTIYVEDNGVGRRKAKELKDTLNQKRESRGMQLMQERMEVYQASEEVQLSAEIIDKHDENQNPTGTLVIIRCITKNQI